MTAPDGAFYSATDADSEGEEGKFFVWSREGDRASVLGAGADTARSCATTASRAGGNFEGANILNAAHPDEAEWAALAPRARSSTTVRARRVPPLRDDKILAAWNGLMISGFAVAGRVLDEPRYVAAAARAADFVLDAACATGGPARAQLQGRARALAAAAGLPRRLRLRGGGPARSLRGDASTRALPRGGARARRRHRAPLRRRAARRLVHDRRAITRRCSRARSRPTTAPSPRARRSRC